ncbi:MAG: ATP-binding protein, partial [Nanoarchaeota archaeon]
MLELAILLREPIAIDYFDEKKKAREILAQVISGSIKTIPALVGEIFTEEARETSATYEGILRAIAVGKINSGEISSYLFSKRIIKKDDPSIIQQYLNNLISFGIIRRIELFEKKRFMYTHVSPLSRIYYYADEKYNLSERKI